MADLGANENINNKKYHIATQLFLVFLCMLLMLSGLNALLNSIFLPSYYQHSKVKDLKKVFSMVKGAEAEDFLTEEFVSNLNNEAMKLGVSIVIIDANSVILFSSSIEERDIEFQLLGYILGRDIETGEVRILEEDDRIVLRELMIKDREFLEMYGRLDSGASFLMRSSVANIRENARYANRFFIGICVLDFLISALVIFLVVRRITRPIKELNTISKKMVDLDFDARYEGRDRNELGELGSNMNAMSEALEKTILELKTANLELQRDIEHREKQDLMRQEFLSNVSHELKSPIALISGYAEGLQLGISDDPESRDYYCSVILDEANRMNSLVKKILTLNNIEFGKDVFNMERFDVTNSVREYLNNSGILAKQQEIEVRFSDTNSYYVWGDLDKTMIILDNFFSNAVRYCLPDEEGKKYIEISLKPAEEKGNMKLCIFNTGHPIPEESIPLLWDKFYKVDKARSRELGGNGVGLSIVKAIQDSMHLGYGVENYENGVLFWFELEGRNS